MSRLRSAVRSYVFFQYSHHPHSFFFQAEDGIRDADVTGVQTCALPILHHRRSVVAPAEPANWAVGPTPGTGNIEVARELLFAGVEHAPIGGHERAGIV